MLHTYLRKTDDGGISVDCASGVYIIFDGTKLLDGYCSLIVCELTSSI